MTRDQIIRKIVFFEKQAKWHCVDGSKQQKHWYAKAHKLRMKQNPPETRELYKLQAIIRTGASHD